MRKYVSEIPGRIEYVQEFPGKTAKDVRMKMDEIIENKSVHKFFFSFKKSLLRERSDKGRGTDP